MNFSQSTIDFLAENRLLNSKEWYTSHKNEYEKNVIAPLKQLMEELTQTMHDIDSKIVCTPKACISRIYRDVRFSKDKSLYRDCMWLIFMREKKLYNGIPGFFFELSPMGFRYGCGYYQASTSSMEKIRELIVNKDAYFKSALKAYENQSVFGMEGDTYKRNKYHEMQEHLQNWLNRKNICFICNSTDSKLLFSKDLAGKLKQDFKLLEPIYKFLIKAEGACE